jgi:hypothetical protein
MTSRILLFALLALFGFSASAAQPGKMRKQVEASMVITGELVVAPDGKVKSYEIDHAEALPPDTRELLAKAIPGWELVVANVDGSPLRAPAAIKMSVQLVARRMADDDERLRVSVQDMAFWDPKAQFSAKANGTLAPPKYPSLAARSGISGMVYLAVLLDADGNVAETHVERVDMTVLANEKTLLKFGRILAEAAVVGSKEWSFTIAPGRFKEGPVTVRVPVDFRLSAKGREYGRWQAYVPGPYAPIPWEKRTADGGDVERSIGAMVPGQIYSTDAPIKLRNSPAGG